MSRGKNQFESDVVLGQKYRDDQTGYEGVATGIFFYQHGCERVSLECYDQTRKAIISEVFDSPRLTHIASQEKVTTPRTGGPARFGENVR